MVGRHSPFCRLGEVAGPCKSRLGFLRGVASRPHYRRERNRSATSDRSLEPPTKAADRLLSFPQSAALSAISIALPRWAIASWNAERRKAWSPALPHHSIAKSSRPSLGEMVRDRLRLGVGADQRVGGAAVQRLAAALEQALVGRVLDQRVPEAIFSLRWGRLRRTRDRRRRAGPMTLASTNSSASATARRSG